MIIYSLAMCARAPANRTYTRAYGIEKEPVRLTMQNYSYALSKLKILIKISQFGTSL
jgi:hypothetical protein